MKLASPLQGAQPPASCPVGLTSREPPSMQLSMKGEATRVCKDLDFDICTLCSCRRQQRLLPPRISSPKKMGLKKPFLTRGPQNCSHSPTLTPPV